MELYKLWTWCILLLLFCLEVMFHLPISWSGVPNYSVLMAPVTKGIQRVINGYRHLEDCEHCMGQKDTGITAAYTDASGMVKTCRIHSRDLSSSWIWTNPDAKYEMKDVGPVLGRKKGSSQLNKRRDGDHNSSADPLKHTRQRRRKLRKLERASALLDRRKDSEYQMVKEAIARSKDLENVFMRTYSIWRPEDEKRKSDYNLKLMKEQITMAKAYALVAYSKMETDLYDSLMKCIKKSQNAIGDADSDAELRPSALEQAKAIGVVLSMANAKLRDCVTLEKTLRAMLQYHDAAMYAVTKHSSFLMHTSAQKIPAPLHCLSLLLTTDYFLHRYSIKEVLDTKKLEDHNLYHYAIFSDNVLSTSVVINSTVMHVKEPEKHVFHVVTDRPNFAAMKMWFHVNSPPGATIHVQNMDDFKWINSSYCPVLRQLESEELKEYYFRSDHPSSLLVADENLKYKNPKYMSMLNHLRFYMPEVHPKLDKILFLDDDVVVQRDLTPLWSIDMKGMVNGAVETCDEGSFHRYDTYLNFSNPNIAKNFDPKVCGWAFGMNIIDLKAWKEQDVTRIYHYWQELNENRTLWKLGTLPPGLITFYNLTYVLDRSWHVQGLGYDSNVQIEEIERAAVVHFNGNNKPWLEFAKVGFKKYWIRFVSLDNPYLRACLVVF